MADDPNPAPAADPATDPNPAPTNPNPTNPAPDDKPTDPVDPDQKEAAKADDEPTALGKKADAEPAKVELPDIIGAPEGDYAVKAPEGSNFDQDAFAAVAPVLKEMNISDKGAQQLVDAYATKVLPLIEKRYEEQAQLQTAELRKTWLNDAKADPEIGGAKWDESVAIAGKVFDAVGIKTEEPFRQLLEESGLGNHPDVVRFMRRVGQMIGEDKLVTADGDPNVNSKPIWDRVYGGPTPAS